ncbi:hypothetical protein CKJ90_32000, partial [Klebsiella pneumoniae]
GGAAETAARRAIRHPAGKRLEMASSQEVIRMLNTGVSERRRLAAEQRKRPLVARFAIPRESG